MVLVTQRVVKNGNWKSERSGCKISIVHVDNAEP
jgi:hypothetical protein